MLDASPSFPTHRVAELIAAAAKADDSVEAAQRRLRAKMAAFSAETDRSIGTFLAKIEQICRSRTMDGAPASSADIESMIQESAQAETYFKSLGRKNSTIMRKIERLKLKAQRPAHAAAVRMTEREMSRVIGKYVAASQEARWMLMALVAELEPRDNGELVTSVADLRALLAAS